MLMQEPRRAQQSLYLAIALSLILHGIVLFVLQLRPPSASRPPARLEASLAPRAPVQPRESVQQPAPQPSPAAPAKPQAKRRILAVEKPRGTTPPGTAAPKWTVAQKQEMDKFLDELGTQAKSAPSLAQRSLAMARGMGRDMARQDGEDSVSLESLPNSPPVDPFSLEMYVDGLVKKLNRSAAFVKNDPRAKGLKTASVQIRLNPNGTLKSFKILNAADQQDEIAFVKAVVEQSVPFSPFPTDIRNSTKSMAMVICIMPATWSGGFGFSRNRDGRGC